MATMTDLERLAELPRWPELEKIKERYPEPKPSFFEEARPLMAMLGEALSHQLQGMRDPMAGMVQVGPEHWQRPGYIPPEGAVGVEANTTNANGMLNVNVAGVVPGSVLAGPTNGLVPDPYWRVPIEDKELVEKMLTELGPEIRVQTEELIKTEMRDSMLLGGNWPRLKELLKSGAKKPKVVRKRQGGRDPLFLQRLRRFASLAKVTFEGEPISDMDFSVKGKSLWVRLIFENGRKFDVEVQKADRKAIIEIGAKPNEEK